MWGRGRTVCEGQQQQRGQSGDDRRQQENSSPTEVIDTQTDKDTSQGARYHPQEVL